MRLPGFIGGSATPISRTINTERSQNIYVERDPGTPKSEASAIIRPALKPWTYIAPGPVRSLYAQDNRLFGVSGSIDSYYYEILQSGNLANGNMPLGQMVGDNDPASISSNGSGGDQNMISSGGQGYIHTLSTNAFAQITDPQFLTPSQLSFYFETYFLNLQRGTNTFQLSEQLDGSAWNGLDTGQCSLTSDQKFSMALLSRTLYFAGQKNIEPWQNTGNASFPIQPEPGIVIEHGIAAPFSFVNLDNTLYWLGQDANGTGLVWRFNGYTPERVSTHPMENIIRRWPTLLDAIGFAFQKNGHAWYLLYSPHNDTTLVYDITTNLWYEWSRWDLRYMRDFPWSPRCAATCWGRTFVGDRTCGLIYEVVLDTYEDEVFV